MPCAPTSRLPAPGAAREARPERRPRAAGHPVADLLLRAWRGPRPDVDGSWARVPPWREGVYAVVAVTGRALVSAPDRVTDADLDAWRLDGWGSAHDPRVMTRLAGEDGWVDVLDAVLLAEGTGAPEPWLVDPARPA